jgi:hypothetical protein
MSRWPIQDEIYTIVAFAETEPGVPGVHLLELPAIQCACCSLNGAAWPIECFRALQERKTDIAALIAILNNAAADDRVLERAVSGVLDDLQDHDKQAARKTT